jgi:hypothetical protein
MASVKEGSLAFLTVSFYNELNVLSAPTSATWEVHDKGSGTVLKTATAMLPIASSYKIELSSSINDLLDSSSSEETRIVTVKASFGADREVNDEHEYDVLGLRYVP